jgi:hypothetical protein
MISDGRRDLAKAVPIQEVAERLGIGGLRRAGAAEMVGPCPVCGGHDRFGINTARGVFNCRRSGEGGDVLALVQYVLACDFQAALDFIVGKADVIPDAQELARRKARAEAADRERAEVAAAQRARAIRDAREIWHAARPGKGTSAEDYLAGRGITFDRWPPTLRFLPDHPYRKHWPGKGVVAWFRGPCMIAAVQTPDGRVAAVHQTWIDPDGNGKARITAPDGAVLDEKGKAWPAKLVRGSKKGGAIRLSPIDPAGRMVMAEGIETTASAMVAGVWPGATFWAGVDLGNMGGVQVKEPGKRWSGKPDLTDAQAWVPPEGIRRLLFVQDGDSDPAATRAKLEAGARRAMATRPGLVAEIMRAEPGTDLNDMLTAAQAADDQADTTKNDRG